MDARRLSCKHGHGLSLLTTAHCGFGTSEVDRVTGRGEISVSERYAWPGPADAHGAVAEQRTPTRPLCATGPRRSVRARGVTGGQRRCRGSGGRRASPEWHQDLSRGCAGFERAGELAQQQRHQPAAVRGLLANGFVRTVTPALAIGKFS